MATKNAVRSAALVAAGFVAGIVASHTTPTRAQARSRVFEIRTYTTGEGHLDALVNRMRQGEARLFDKAGMKGMFFAVASEAPNSQSTFVYMVAHDSLEAAKQSWAKFLADPEFKQLLASAESPGQIKVESVFVTPTDFSPLK